MPNSSSKSNKSNKKNSKSNSNQMSEVEKIRWSNWMRQKLANAHLLTLDDLGTAFIASTIVTIVWFLMAYFGLFDSNWITEKVGEQKQLVKSIFIAVLSGFITFIASLMAAYTTRGLKHYLS